MWIETPYDMWTESQRMEEQFVKWSQDTVLQAKIGRNKGHYILIEEMNPHKGIMIVSMFYKTNTIGRKVQSNQDRIIVGDFNTPILTDRWIIPFITFTQADEFNPGSGVGGGVSNTDENASKMDEKKQYGWKVKSVEEHSARKLSLGVGQKILEMKKLIESI